jgi:3'-5' exoribonuclease
MVGYPCNERGFLHRLPSGGHSIFVALMQLRQLQVGASVAMALLVREAKVRTRREGGELLKLTLGDRTGSVPAVVLDGVEAARDACRAGEVVFVVGSFEDQAPFGARLVVEAVRRAAEHEYDRGELIDGPGRAADALEADLRGLVATVQNPHLRRLLAALLGEGSAVWAQFREAPAAKHYHQA